MKVELKNVTKKFGHVLANDAVSLTVEAGSIHGLLGENGAGKSTLVKILSGFISRDQGLVLLDGQPGLMKTPEEAIATGIGMLHQDPLDFPPLSVLDNFMVGQQDAKARLNNRSHKSHPWLLDRQTAIRQFQDLADQFGFALDPKETVGNLTVGERQQLEILRLISLGVNTLILDEPTTGISASQQDALFAAAKKLASQGKSVIFVSHKLEDVDLLCDRVTIMRQGRVVGNAEIPCPSSQLVSLMFEKELATPSKPATAQTQVNLSLEGVVIKDDRLQVQIDQLQVKKGEILGLAGLEGSGQRLLTLLCAGLLSATTGKIEINGMDMTRRSYREYLRQGVGYLPADRLEEGLIRGLSIQDHITLRQSQGNFFVNWSEMRQKTQSIIDFFNIRGKPASQVERLSGGNQQRTQLALLPTPLNLLLMEHPTRGLDIDSSLWVWQQLIARCQTGTTILFASSDLDEIMQYSDRLLIFSGGQVSAPIPVSLMTAQKLGEAIGGNIESNVSPQEKAYFP
jgi:general nucleoside transport system ATP-binding protein